MSSNSQAKIGSLKDRIAKFNNPDSTPLVPQSAFGYGAPPKADPSQVQGKGLIGNRIPSYNAKNIAPEVIVGTRKKVENRGLYGNRIPAFAKSDGSLASSVERPRSPRDGRLEIRRDPGQSSASGEDAGDLHGVGGTAVPDVGNEVPVSVPTTAGQQAGTLQDDLIHPPDGNSSVESTPYDRPESPSAPAQLKVDESAEQSMEASGLASGTREESPAGGLDSDDSLNGGQRSQTISCGQEELADLRDPAKAIRRASREMEPAHASTIEEVVSPEIANRAETITDLLESSIPDSPAADADMISPSLATHYTSGSDEAAADSLPTGISVATAVLQSAPGLDHALVSPVSNLALTESGQSTPAEVVPILAPLPLEEQGDVQEDSTMADFHNQFTHAKSGESASCLRV
jgi:hypothetical protein